MNTVEKIDRNIAELVRERVDIDAEIARLEALKDANTEALKAYVAERESIAGATTQIPAGRWKLIVSKTKRVDTKAVRKHTRMLKVLIAVGEKLVARDAEEYAIKAGTSAEGIKMASAEYPGIVDIIDDCTKTTVTFKVMEVKN